MDAASGLREYKRRATRAALVGLGSFLLGGALISRIGVVAGAATVWGAMGLVFGIVGLVRVARIRRLSSSAGWRKRSALFDVIGGGNGQPALMLTADGVEAEAVLGIATTVFRWNALRGTDWLWVTGNPLSRFAAVATPDGAHVIVVKRPIVRWWRKRLRRIATSA